MSATAITQLICAKPFRRSAVDAATATDIQSKVETAINSKQPIHFSVPFGGYKALHQPLAPHINWAEVFWLDYLRSYGRRIAAQHEPGVVFSFSYFSAVLDWLNGYPSAAQAIYINELQQICQYLSEPKLRFELVDFTTMMGGQEQVLTQVEPQYQAYLFGELAAPTDLSGKLKSAASNLLTSNAQNFSQDSAAIRHAAMRCALLEALPIRRNFNKFGNHIQLTHIKGASLALHLGSCRTSIAQPWVSSGWLERHGQQWLPRIGNAQTRAQPCKHRMLKLPTALDLPGLQQLAMVGKP